MWNRVGSFEEIDTLVVVRFLISPAVTIEV